MNRRRVLVLVHGELLAPDDLTGLTPQQVHDVKSEYDVVSTLRSRGHEVRQVGVTDDLAPIRRAVGSFRPHVVFNLLEEFNAEALYDHNVVSYLELLGVPYTGCGPRGLVLTRDKSLAKKLVAYHRIRVPRFFIVKRGRRTRPRHRLRYPLIVKSLVEEASISIAKASIVTNAEKLVERVRFVHENVETDAIIEEFIDGREIYAAVLGNQRLQVLPPQELVIANRSENERLIATEKVKHDPEYQEKRGVDVVGARLPEEQQRRLERIARRIYRALELRGYARIDFRLSESGEFYFLEANPNPEIARGEEVAEAARTAGLDYPELLEKILRLGMRPAT